tara:strand:+ start:3424 stop:4602 length:1179 start_codon:yes stop_codon:yes gene_type:complete
MIDFDPYDEQFMSGDRSIFARLREEEPAYYSEKYKCWFFSRYEDVKSISTDYEHFSVKQGVTTSQLLLEEPTGSETFALMDLPRHKAHRSLIQPEYLKGRIAEFRPRAEKFLLGFMDPLLEQGNFEVIHDLVLPASLRLVSSFIGLPDSLAKSVRDLLRIYWTRKPGQIGTSEEGGQAMMELITLIKEYIPEKRDLISEEKKDHLEVWLNAEIEGKKYSNDEIANLVMTMIIGGSDTVPLTVSNTLLLLDKHPHFKEAIIKDLSLISNAYNETIRYEHPNNMLGRTVIKETNFYNKSLKAGDKVMMLFASALRDERVFEDPDKYDIYRDSLSAITFGIGIHKCVGEHLARLEAKIILEHIFKRIPDYKINYDGVKDLYSEFVKGHSAVPIIF